MEKLFVVVRNDLDPGLQMAQAIHAAIKYVLTHEEEARRWYEESNNLAVLQVPDEETLGALAQRVSVKDPAFQSSIFEEPDLDGARTAAAFCGGAKKLVSSLPLALRDHSMPMKAGGPAAGYSE